MFYLILTCMIVILVNVFIIFILDKYTNIFKPTDLKIEAPEQIIEFLKNRKSFECSPELLSFAKKMKEALNKEDNNKLPG